MVNWRQYFNLLESCMHILRCWTRKERHWIVFYLGKCMFIKLERILLNFYRMKTAFQGSKSTSRIRMDNRNDTHPTWYARLSQRSMEQGLDLGCASQSGQKDPRNCCRSCKQTCSSGRECNTFLDHVNRDGGRGKGGSQREMFPEEKVTGTFKANYKWTVGSKVKGHPEVQAEWTSWGFWGPQKDPWKC